MMVKKIKRTIVMKKESMMNNSMTAWIIIFLCLLAIPGRAQEYKNTDKRIIVQFHLSSLSQFLQQYESDSPYLFPPEPSCISRIVEDDIIDRLKKKFIPEDMDAINKLKELVLFSYEHISESDIKKICELLNKSPLVEYAEPDSKIKGTYIPTDTLYEHQWDMARIGMEQVWEHTHGSREVIVAVLDTGVDYTHPDLFENLVPGYDFCNGDDDPYDDAYDSYHGTHVAGIIASRGNNKQGIAGIAWDVKIMPLKILNEDVEGDASIAAAAITHAVAEGADIINMSWGQYTQNTALQEAIQLAWDMNKVIFITSAGNGGIDREGDDIDRIPFYPACYDMDNIITVAATGDVDSEEELASFSNYGMMHVDLAAPGTNVISTIGQNRYQTKSGTSMAAPHVAGTAALIKSVYPDLTPGEIIDAIMWGVDPLPALAGKVKTGGRLNVYNALLAIEGSLPLETPVPEDPPLPTPAPVTDLLLKYQCMESLETTTNIKLSINITSRDTKNIDLADVTLRYYYTKEGISDEEVIIDYASIDIAAITAATQDGYIEIGFTPDAGILRDTDSFQFHVRMYKLDFTNYDQSNDYSFDPQMSEFHYYKKIPLYVKSERVWGYEPENPAPSPTPTIPPQTTPEVSPSPTPVSTDPPGDTPSPSPAGEPTPISTPVVNKGDVNNNGIIDVVDALLVAQYYVGLDPIAFVEAAADVDCNERIDIIDALIICQYYVGLISEFC
jgi:hypothetical protein